MKRILCFGDSNTWGCDPANTESRFDQDTRWTGVLARELAGDAGIIEDGLNGRAAGVEDPLSPGLYAPPQLLTALSTHYPLDMVLILLGTNDVSYRWMSAGDTADAVGRLVDIVQRSEAGPGGSPPTAVMLCPPVVGPIPEEEVAIYGDAVDKSRALPEEFDRVAKAYGCQWIDISGLVTTSPLDGWHWEAPQHRRLGVMLAAAVPSLSI
jgi:lysophospholipase L1-like esterase